MNKKSKTKEEIKEETVFCPGKGDIKCKAIWNFETLKCSECGFEFDGADRFSKEELIYEINKTNELSDEEKTHLLYFVDMPYICLDKERLNDLSKKALTNSLEMQLHNRTPEAHDFWRKLFDFINKIFGTQPTVMNSPEI